MKITGLEQDAVLSVDSLTKLLGHHLMTIHLCGKVDSRVKLLQDFVLKLNMTVTFN